MLPRFKMGDKIDRCYSFDWAGNKLRILWFFPMRRHQQLAACPVCIYIGHFESDKNTIIKNNFLEICTEKQRIDTHLIINCLQKISNVTDDGIVL